MGKLWRRLALFAPLVLLMVAVNYRMDPGHLFGGEGPEARMADELVAGRSVVAGFALDELLLQQSLAERRPHAPDVLVLGSSRSMTLSAEAFPGQAVVMNASVSSASLEDVIALLELYEQHGLRPRTVLLAIEPWALNGSLRNPSVALDSQLQAGLRRMGRGAGSTYGALPVAIALERRWLRLVSPAYFQASLGSLFARGFVKPRAGTPPPGGAGGQAARAASSRMEPDGSVEWEPVLTGRTTAEVLLMANATGASAPGYLQADPDPERVLLLGAWLGNLESRGVRVVLWLAPFHPAAYGTLVAGNHGRGLWRGEEEIRGLAAASRVPVLGSYDPARSGVLGEDFIDYNHLRRRQANALEAGQLAAAGIDLALRH